MDKLVVITLSIVAISFSGGLAWGIHLLNQKACEKTYGPGFNVQYNRDGNMCTDGKQLHKQPMWF
jgi:hypothetical protein